MKGGGGSGIYNAQGKAIICDLARTSFSGGNALNEDANLGFLTVGRSEEVDCWVSMRLTKAKQMPEENVFGSY